VIVSGSAVSVGADSLIPFDTTWKYLLINTNETIEIAFRSPSFNDSSWLGPSNALFYFEADAVAGPQNTELSLFVPGTVDTRINTFYFRKNFLSPSGSSNITMRLRHVVDDGFVLYLNGGEIYRFGFGATDVVTAASQPANHENTLEGPFLITNVTIFAVNNVLAAEVHQNGSASADVVFGIELSFSIPSIPLEPECALVAPVLLVERLGTNLVLSWTNSCLLTVPFTLQQATALAAQGGTTVWTSLTTNSPYIVSPTTTARFFRLRN